MPHTNLSTVSHFLKSIPLSLALILLAVTFLRIPNFFEPYWYGDEGIYLVIGKAMNRGSLLYTDIVDHKTPLIYYLARVDSQLGFRVLLYGWMIFSTTAFYYISKKLLISEKATLFATVFFAALTTLPWLEGNIPNGELFVIGFVLAGLWIATGSQYFQALIQPQKNARYKITTEEILVLIASGIFYGLGILTKVPGLFDAAALFTIGYFLILYKGFSSKKIFSGLISGFLKFFTPMVLVFVGILIPIIASVLYFYWLGSGQDYLDFGLLYNFKYAGTWQLGITNPILAFFFTLPGKVAFLALAFFILSLHVHVLAPRKLFILGWFFLAFIASLLSNRPYPHYFLQVIPPLALVIALAGQSFWSFLKFKKGSKATFITFVLSIISFSILAGIMLVMKVGGYPTISYYQDYLLYATNSISQEEYFQRFNYLMKENYEVAALIKSENPDKIFIWGTNPMLYALSDTRPVGRFTVSFHIEDLDLEEVTYQTVKEEKPLYIVVMKNQTSPLPGLENLLDKKYMPVKATDHMVVWRKLNKSRYN